MVPVGGGFWILWKKGLVGPNWMPVIATLFFFAGILLLAIDHERYMVPGILFEIGGGLVLTGYALIPRSLKQKKKTK